MGLNRKLRLAMIGGGRNAFIGSIHRIAIHMDGLCDIVAGALSSNPDNARLSGQDIFLSPQRTYTDYRDMIQKESSLPASEKPDIISIVTPNHLHFQPALAALQHGFHVAIDKPITFSTDEALLLKDALTMSGKQLLLTHTYTGYPMIKQARLMIKDGTFGKIQKIYVEYPQGWLSTNLEKENNKQASWRTDPSKSGKAGAMGDIGTHAFDLVEYVSGLKVSKMCADINTIVPGRRLDDDGAVLLEFDNGATGTLIATQIAAGEENNLRIRIYGEKGGIDWQQADCNSLKILWPDRPVEIYRTGAGYLKEAVLHNTRTPAGHPEGYLEAFANLYRNFFLTVDALDNGNTPKEEWLDFPSIDEGIRGMRFIDLVV
ncbi:MAG TPA: Gfo/Idh/MocA family oxidoreductase, partial [Saprospiraceae bacterium]|nr:Gfo/Idh/MocA family oxidoreductase [Saprospiraceae bacterium]